MSCSELEAGDSMPGDRFVLFRAGKHGMLGGARLVDRIGDLPKYR